MNKLAYIFLLFLSGCGLAQQIQIKNACQASETTLENGFKVIKANRMSADEVKKALITKHGKTSYGWDLLILEMRKNPNLTWAEFKAIYPSYGKDCFNHYYPPDMPIVRSKDEQYCYETSMTCWPNTVDCENACNIQMRAIRNYQR